MTHSLYTIADRQDRWHSIPYSMLQTILDIHKISCGCVRRTMIRTTLCHGMNPEDGTDTSWMIRVIASMCAGGGFFCLDEGLD